MKKTILVAMVLWTVSPMVGKERTVEEKRLLVRSVIESRCMARGKLSAQPQTLAGNDVLTVMGYADGGFAIVANDDDLGGIIGYADGCFKMNSSLEWYINAASEAMRMTQKERSAVYTVSLCHEKLAETSIEPLLSSTWNQKEPYNGLCPKDDKGNNYPSGCVATAMSQIMYYHKYPERGIGSKTYSFKPTDGQGKILSANFAETTYCWTLMKDNYVYKSYTAEEAEAVATLTLHCGVAVEMNYTPTGSGAYTTEARNGLISNFGYHPNIGVFYRNYYSLSEWMRMVYTELSQGRPIFYTGVDSSRGGHAFVIDGYDTDGLVHVNWGWGADGGNGYFDIALLNSSNGQFCDLQDMLLGIDKPEHDGIEYESHIVSDDDLTVSIFGTMLNVNAGDRLWNLCGFMWTGDLAILLQAPSGQTYVLQRQTARDVLDRYNVRSKIDGILGGFTKLPSDMVDGEYRLFVGAKNDHDNDWRLVRRPSNKVNSYIVTVMNGKPSVAEPQTDDAWIRQTTDVSHPTINRTAYNNSSYDLQGHKVGSNARGLVIEKQGNTVKKVVR